MKIRPFLYVLVAFSLLLGGCHARKLPEEKPATELVADGQKKFDARDYVTAITDFQRVKDWYPFSDLVPTAELKIAEARYKLRQYDEAATAYEDFANLHPRNPSTPYALYQAGRCYFDQLATIDLDQEKAKKALDSFKQFVARYPHSAYTALARAHIIDCERNLASHELLIAKFYFKRKNYKAALMRFRRVLSQYPDAGVQYIALQYLSKCEALSKAEGSALPQPGPVAIK